MEHGIRERPRRPAGGLLSMDPKQWLVLSVTAPSEELVAELSEGLIALGGAAVEERGRRLTTYLQPPEDTEAFLRTALDHLDWVAGGEAVDLEWSFQEDEDWARRWKRGLGPRRVGSRFVVAPTWTEPETRPDDILIRIDPAMAFGTGEHGTTRGMLRLMEGVRLEGARVLDVGTGSGILAVAAVGLGARSVLAVDEDPDAIENALLNVERNGAASRVTLREGRVDAPFLDREGEGVWDVILANVLSGVLEPLLPAFRRGLVPGGRLLLSGILEDEAERMRAAADRAGLQVEAEDEEDEWWSARFVLPEG